MSRPSLKRRARAPGASRWSADEARTRSAPPLTFAPVAGVKREAAIWVLATTTISLVLAAGFWALRPRAEQKSATTGPAPATSRVATDRGEASAGSLGATDSRAQALEASTSSGRTQRVPSTPSAETTTYHLVGHVTAPTRSAPLVRLIKGNQVVGEAPVEGGGFRFEVTHTRWPDFISIGAPRCRTLLVDLRPELTSAAPPWKSVEAVSPTETILRFEVALEAGFDLRGELRWADGTPCADAVCEMSLPETERLYSTFDGLPPTTSDSLGRFRIDGLPAVGLATLRVSPPGLRTWETLTVELARALEAGGQVPPLVIPVPSTLVVTVASLPPGIEPAEASLSLLRLGRRGTSLPTLRMALDKGPVSFFPLYEGESVTLVFEAERRVPAVVKELTIRSPREEVSLELPAADPVPLLAADEGGSTIRFRFVDEAGETLSTSELARRGIQLEDLWVEYLAEEGARRDRVLCQVSDPRVPLSHEVRLASAAPTQIRLTLGRRYFATIPDSMVGVGEVAVPAPMALEWAEQRSLHTFMATDRQGQVVPLAYGRFEEIGGTDSLEAYPNQDKESESHAAVLVANLTVQLLPVAYRFQVRSLSGQLHTGTVLQDGETTHRMVFDKASELDGTIDGLACGQLALVSLIHASGPIALRPLTVRADTGGAFRLSGISPGSYTLSILISTAEQSSLRVYAESVDVPAGEVVHKSVHLGQPPLAKLVFASRRDEWAFGRVHSGETIFYQGPIRMGMTLEVPPGTYDVEILTESSPTDRRLKTSHCFLAEGETASVSD